MSWCEQSILILESGLTIYIRKWAKIRRKSNIIQDKLSKRKGK